MQSSKWNAMSLLMDDKTKQAEVLRTAIEEAEAIVIELVQACLHRTALHMLGNALQKISLTLLKSIVSLICCKQVCIRTEVGKNIGHLRVALSN